MQRTVRTRLLVSGGSLLLAGTAAVVATPPAHARDFWPGSGAYYNGGYLPPVQSYSSRSYSPRGIYYGSRRDTSDEPRVDYLKAKTAEQLRKAPVPAPTKGPLMVVVSISKQHLTLYDDGVAIAHSPISTGVPGHSTPKGIFSVIQKARWHRSNLYSDAPMPFMQRITWSGVALHAGVVPGHPASHGCIRMPNDFAIRMWRTTQMGARVIVLQNDVAPVAFAHPALFKYVPQTIIVPPANAPQAGTTLRPSLGSDVEASASPRGAADHKAAAPVPVAAPVAPAVEPAAESGPAKRSDAGDDVAPVKVAEIAEMRGGQVATPVVSDQPAPEASALRPTLQVKDAAPASDPENTGATDKNSHDVASPQADPAAATQQRIVVPVITPASPPVFATPAPAPAPMPALADVGSLRKGAVSVFISGKERRLYVRKGFAPVFDVPVTIAEPGKPLGTHVFTALALEGDGHTMRWNVLTMPEGRAAEPEKRAARGQKHKEKEAVVQEAPKSSTQSAKQALDRIEMPANAVAQISELMSVGASLIVSDEGLGPETGKETDFIVLTKN